MASFFGRARLGVAIVSVVASFAVGSHAATGTCDVSPGEYTAWTGTPADLETAATTTAGVSEARCFKDIRSLGGFVVEDVFRDGKGRFAHELPSFGKLVNMWPGENGNTICNGFFKKGERNNPRVVCVDGWNKTFAQMSEFGNALDWKYVNSVRYDPSGRKACPTFGMGCFGGRCYDPECVNADGTQKTCGAGEVCIKGACATGDASTLPTCTNIDPQATAIGDGNKNFYNPWDALVYDLGGLANKVAIFAVNDHGPQPCESNEYTVFLTNNPASREMIDNPGKDGADPNKWNRAKLFKIYTHGWVDNGACFDNPKADCKCELPDGTGCTVPKVGDPPVLEADSMSLVFSLPCGIAFRYAAFIAGYDGKGLDDPAKGEDRCAFHSFDAEIDAVAGLNDDESAICPDKDGDGFPTCDCAPKPNCDCVDDPAKDPDAKKYHPGAPQACEGPEYSCAPTPCPPGLVCYAKQCLKPCNPGEFKCTGGFTCQKAPGVDGGAAIDVCVPSACGDAGVCEPGFLCIDGKCVDPCDGAKCPAGQFCQDGKCVDPCALIKCPAGQKCQNGVCADSCACLAKTASGYPCKGETPTCDKKTGDCVPPGCDTTTCPPGKHCEGSPAGPVCRGACEGVICPKGTTCDDTKGCVSPCDLLTKPCPMGTICKAGACIDEECAFVDCSPPFICQKGKCVDPGASEICFGCDSGTDAIAPDDASTDDAGVADASFSDTADPFAPPETTEKTSCNCSAPGSASGKTALALSAMALVLTGLMRRRRR